MPESTYGDDLRRNRGEIEMVDIFGVSTPVPALKLLWHLEDEEYALRIDTDTGELCITPSVPRQLRAGITRYRSHLVRLVASCEALGRRTDEALVT